MTSHKKLTSILELFLDKEEMSLSEISDITKLHKSTVSRITSFLVGENYLQRNGKRGKYSLGAKFLEFNYAMKNRVKIRNVAMRCMQKLKDKVEESCALILWDGQKAIVVDSIDHDSVLQASPSRKSEISLHKTAGGRIFLANMDEEDRKRYLNSQNMTETAGLEEEIKLIKEQDFAIELEGNIIGVSSIAVGIKDNEERILGVVTVIGPTARLPYRKLVAIVPDVKECALEIARWLE